MTAGAVNPSVRALPGDGALLGATPVDDGVNFAVASSVAQEVTVCLFDAATGEEIAGQARALRRRGLARLRAGGRARAAYGYRVTGPFDPARGLRCNPAKLLLDPYARAISGAVTYGPALLGHDRGRPGQPSELDSAAVRAQSLVVSGTATTGRATPVPAIATPTPSSTSCT